ncbi:MAG: hypothetical protein AAFR82_02550 [Pseudomonadota bacterium]
MSVEFMMGTRGVGHPVLRTNAAEALVSAINERLFESSDALHQRTRLSDVSYRLRCAFSFAPEDLPQLPLQLGQDYHKASDYVQQAINAWLESDELTNLFAYLCLDDATETGIRNLLINSVNIQPLATWLCNEFGEIRTSRQALHSRRYVAVRLTRDAMASIVDAAKDMDETREQRQAQLDIWTDLECPIQNSLHYRTVIAPICNWLLQQESDHQAKVVGMHAANEERPLVHAPLRTPFQAPNTAGSEYVDASVLQKGLRSIA